MTTRLTPPELLERFNRRRDNDQAPASEIRSFMSHVNTQIRTDLTQATEARLQSELTVLRRLLIKHQVEIDELDNDMKDLINWILGIENQSLLTKAKLDVLRWFRRINARLRRAVPTPEASAPEPIVIPANSLQPGDVIRLSAVPEEQLSLPIALGDTSPKRFTCMHCQHHIADGPHILCPHCGAEWGVNVVLSAEDV